MFKKKYLTSSFNLLLSGLLIVLSCHAEQVDPTQPPEEIAVENKSVEATAEPAEKKDATKKGDLALTAILHSAKRIVAIVNGRPVTVGDRVDGYQVLTINRDTVLLKGTTGIKKLSLTQSIKQPVTRKVLAP